MFYLLNLCYFSSVNFSFVYCILIFLQANFCPLLFTFKIFASKFLPTQESRAAASICWPLNPFLLTPLLPTPPPPPSRREKRKSYFSQSVRQPLVENAFLPFTLLCRHLREEVFRCKSCHFYGRALMWLHFGSARPRSFKLPSKSSKLYLWTFKRREQSEQFLRTLSLSRVTLCDVMNFQEYSQVPQWGAAASQGYFYIFLFLHFPSLLLAALSMRK